MLPHMGLWAQRDTSNYIDGNNIYPYNGPIWIDIETCKSVQFYSTAVSYTGANQ